MVDLLSSGIRTVVVTTMANILGIETIGKEINETFIKSLPAGIDVNGENGEYHTFCFDGPIFHTPIMFSLGEPYLKSYDVKLYNGEVEIYSYYFADLDTVKKKILNYGY